MDENAQWYYTDKNGQQTGPVSLAQLKTLIQQSSVTEQSMVWSEGMQNWQRLGDVDGLSSTTTPAPNPAAQRTHEPTPEPTTGAANPYAPPQTHVTATVTGDDYPLPDVKRTNYGLMAAAIIIGFGILVVGFSQMFSSAQAAAYEYSSNPDYYTENYSGTNDNPFSTTSIILTLAGFAVFMFGVILSFIYLHRAWRIVQPGGASTTPGKAVGFLFIPLFNFYWYFIAYWKWSQDWNRIASNYSKLHAAPRAAEGLFLGYAIVNVIGAVVNLASLAGIVLLLILMKQVCNVVNYVHDLRLNQLGQQSGGMALR